MMDNLPDIGENPDYGLSKKVSHNVTSLQFDDGYMQESAPGINATKRKWNIKWSGITAEQAKTLDDFLTSKKGFITFLWSHPSTGEQIKVKCREHDVSEDKWNSYTVNTSFEESFQ